MARTIWPIQPDPHTQDSVAALRAFTTREVEQGTRFHYASNQTVALTLLLRAVTGTP